MLMKKLLAITTVLTLWFMTEAVAWGADTTSNTNESVVTNVQLQQHTELAKQVGQADVVWLNVAAGKFLGLYQQDRSGLELGAMLLIADQNNHPNWPQNVGPLRRYLPEHGWHTLSISSVISDTYNDEPNAHQTQNMNRINSALKHLESTSNQRLAIIGKGTGAYWAAIYLKNNPSVQAGLIMIDAKKPSNQTDDMAEVVAQLSRPVLDLYYAKNNLAARDRLSYSRRNPRAYYQQNLITQPKDHWIKAHDPLTRRIKGWIKNNL